MSRTQTSVIILSSTETKSSSSGQEICSGPLFRTAVSYLHMKSEWQLVKLYLSKSILFGHNLLLIIFLISKHTLNPIVTILQVSNACNSVPGVRTSDSWKFHLSWLYQQGVKGIVWCLLLHRNCDNNNMWLHLNNQPDSILAFWNQHKF